MDNQHYKSNIYYNDDDDAYLFTVGEWLYCHSTYLFVNNEINVIHVRTCEYMQFNNTGDVVCDILFPISIIITID